jgi:hypothetical protein
MSGNGNMFSGDVAVGWDLDNGTVPFSVRIYINFVFSYLVLGVFFS